MLGIRTKTGLIAAALCGFSHGGWADSVSIGGDLTFNVGDYLYEDPPSMESHKGFTLFTLVFSDEMLRLFNAADITLTASGSTIVRELIIADAFVAAASTIDIMSSQRGPGTSLIEASSLGNGLTFSAPTGASLTLKEWVINTQTREIKAQAVGSNGREPVDAQLFWQAQTITARTYEYGGEYPVEGYTADITDLTWSDNSRHAFGQALGLEALPAWNAVHTLGSISLDAESPLPAIPEPSTYALMGLGLVGIRFAARRCQVH